MSTKRTPQPKTYLSRREQQIMELVYQRERVTAAEVTELLPGEASNSTVRTMLRLLEEKGKLRHIEKGGKYIYLPVEPRQASGRSALLRVAETFFRGSIGDVVVTLLSEDGYKLSDEELDRLQEAIEKARTEPK